jgi:hypothetical protein
LQKSGELFIPLLLREKWKFERDDDENYRECKSYQKPDSQPLQSKYSKRIGENPNHIKKDKFIFIRKENSVSFFSFRSKDDQSILIVVDFSISYYPLRKYIIRLNK